LKLIYKLSLALLLLSVVPLSISGWVSTRINQEALVGKIEELHQRTAKEMARELERSLQNEIRDIQVQLGYIRFRDFSPEEMEGGLNVIYLQNDAINIVSLFDENGEPPRGISSKFITDLRGYDERFKNHNEMTLDEVEEYIRRIPFEKAKAQGAAIGEVYVSQRKRMAVLPVAVAVHGPGQARWVLSIELSLDQVQDTIAAQSWGSPAGAFLFDARGRLIAHRDLSRALTRESVEDLGIVQRALKGSAAFGVERFRDGKEEMLGAYARLPSLGWGVVLFHPMSDALVSVQAMRNQTLFWIGASMALAAVVGFLFARGISRPVNLLAEGARRIAMGDFEHRINVSARDEIGLLSEAFNYMGTELQSSLQKIETQNRELERWNQELQQRVDERTRELKEAQDQLLMSQKLAAVGELGAGVAHEMNNPLAGVLGLTQLLLMKVPATDPTHGSLKAIEKEALRMREIVRSLLRFSQAQEGTSFGPVSLATIADESLAMLERQLMEQEVEVVRDYADDVPRISGDSAQLQQCVLHILNNAKTAMPSGGRLTLKTDHLDRKVARLRITDTGRGIPKENLEKIFEPFFTTKDEWSGKGLGLSVAYRTVLDHKGKITVDSEVGKGTTFALSFPALAEKTHLV
jgi:signal transduction histidine kinase